VQEKIEEIAVDVLAEDSTIDNNQEEQRKREKRKSNNFKK
jgi:hypothetical protein